MGGIYVDFSVVNQLNSPALNSNTFANRPSAGQAGRLFISTDTFEIYRDNGATWDLIGGPGSSTITGTGTAGNFPIFTSSQAIGNSEMYYTEGANFNNINFGYTGTGAKYATTELNIFSNNESRIFLQFDSNKYAQLSNEFGNVYLLANNSGIHGANNVFYYNGSSTTDRYLSFQTEGLDRLTIEQNGDIQLNKYTTDGFLRTSGANGTLSIDTNTYVTNNIYTADGTLAAARTVNLNNHNLRFEGAANTARVRISANNNVPRIFSFATADSARWALRVDGNETGSNAGANFELRRYNDAGNYVSSPIIVNRASGNVGIGGGLQQLETFNVTGSSLFSHSYTQNNDFNRKGVFAFLNTTTNVGAGFTNGYNYNALSGLHWDNFSASTTIPNGVTIGGTYSGGQVGFDTINTTVTLAQGSGGGLRTFSGVISQIGLAAPTTGGVVTHASGFQALAPYYIGANLPTITNYFGVAINDSTEYSSVAITNRWGVYQNGATDLNYFNGNVLIGSATDNGNKLQVTGQANISSNLLVQTNSLGAAGFNLSTGSNITWAESTNESYANIFRQRNSAATVIAHGYRRSGTAPWASSLSISLNRAAIVVGENAGSIAFYSDTATTVPSGTDITTAVAKMVLLNNGNFGIGAAPTSRLTVAGNIEQTSTANTVFTNNIAVVSSSADMTLEASTADIRLSTSGLAKMIVRNSGNVLIGTTTDNGRLFQVNGGGIFTGTGYDTTNSAEIELNNTTPTTGKKFILNSTNNGDFQIADKTAGGATRFLVNSSGNTIIYGSVKTDAPTGGTAQPWKLGTVATVSPTSPNRTIEVEINGTTYYIHAKTTNN